MIDQSLWSALPTVAGQGALILGLPAVAGAIYLVVRRTWVAIGGLVVAVLPFAAIAHWQNPAIAAPLSKLLALAGALAAVALLAAVGAGVARLLAREAARIGAGATAMATALPLVLGTIGPLAGVVIARMEGPLSPAAAFNVGAVVAVGLTALAFPLGWISRSVAGTTIGTSAGFLLLSLWPVALSNAVDAGQGMLVLFLLIPLIPVAWLLARSGAKRAAAPTAGVGA
jgi:hypothetical protein